MRYFAGIDLAKVEDYAALVILEEIKEKGSKPKLKLKVIKQWKVNYYDLLREVEGIIKRYEPAKIGVDSTNEKAFADYLERLHYPVNAIHFTHQNKGEMKDYTRMLIESRRLLLPDPRKMIFSNTKELVINLKEQMEAEQMINSHGTIRYDHPSGKHNDLLVALELACHAAKPFIETPPPCTILQSKLDAGDDKAKVRRENIEWVKETQQQGFKLAFCSSRR